MPRWEEMLNWTVWRNAAEQMFFSLSVSWGGLITFGSYNKFKNPVHHQALAIRDDGRRVDDIVPRNILWKMTADICLINGDFKVEKKAL